MRNSWSESSRSSGFRRYVCRSDSPCPSHLHENQSQSATAEQLGQRLVLQRSMQRLLRSLPTPAELPTLTRDVVKLIPLVEPRQHQNSSSSYWSRESCRCRYCAVSWRACQTVRSVQLGGAVARGCDQFPLPAPTTTLSDQRCSVRTSEAYDAQSYATAPF